jgi:hypothetical protein
MGWRRINHTQTPEPIVERDSRRLQPVLPASPPRRHRYPGRRRLSPAARSAASFRQSTQQSYPGAGWFAVTPELRHVGSGISCFQPARR